MIDAALAELEPLTSAKTACELLGKSRATLYRQRNPAPVKERPPAAGTASSGADPAERDALLAALNIGRFADKSPAQAWAILLDEGIYLASISTMYRVLRRETKSGSAAPRPLTRPGSAPNWSPTARTRSGPGISRN